MRPDELLTLPDDLPVPEDDGAADHLPGMALPPVALPGTDGAEVRLDTLPGRTVVFAYPRTARPGEEIPGGTGEWNAIPGARGCSLEAVADAEHLTGRFDYQVRVACRDTAELDRILRHFKRDGGVAETETRVVLRSALRRDG